MALYPWEARLVPSWQTYICIWMCKKLVSLLRTMGVMSVTHSGILQWTLNCGDIVALQQFRDNLMVAAKGPTPKTAMYTVCCTMESIWGLRVVCPCLDKDPNLVCHGDCMGPPVRCVSIYVSPSCTLAHAHPNALDANWQLKFGAPLQSHWAATTRHTTNVLLSALSSVLPFVHSWGSFLLSVRVGCNWPSSQDTQPSPCAHLQRCIAF